MSSRRFLYLVANDGVAGRSYSLRRIDMSRFFFRASMEGTPTPLDSSGGAGAADPSAVDDGGGLPDPVINLCPPNSEHDAGRIGFVLFKKEGNGGHNQVVAIDNTRRSRICDPDLPPTVVRALPSLASSKVAPFSLTVGDNSLYVMDAVPVTPSGRKRHTFEVLSIDDDGGSECKRWHWSPLDPPPPHVYGPPGHGSTRIESYAVVAGTSIAVSSTFSRRTYKFDTVNKAWSKAGDWALPFARLAEYLPEHKLWFGISPIEDGHRFCAANLVASPDSDEMRPPLVHGFWKDYAEPPPEWRLGESYAVHLGSSRFCIVRFFVVYGSMVHVCPVSYSPFRVEEELQVVLTGVEVESCGEELRVVKHKSERYKLDLDFCYRVL